MNEFWETPQKKKLNKKKLAVLIIILILLISIIIIAIIYNNNKQFKNWMDKNIFNKEVMQANTNTIELENENSKICAFNKKIGVLNKNQFIIRKNKNKSDYIVKNLINYLTHLLI